MSNGSPASLWKQIDPYYWSGPDGWSICKVIQNGDDYYELWQGSKACVSRAKTLKAAQKAHLVQTSKN